MYMLNDVAKFSPRGPGPALKLGLCVRSSMAEALTPAGTTLAMASGAREYRS